MTRRELLASLPLLRPGLAAPAPAGRVALAPCKSYGAELLPALRMMFDQLGGLGRLVSGKTVAIKLNLTGSPNYRLGYLPAERAHWTHPRVIAATVHLMAQAGARRIRLLESPWSTAEPVEEYMLEANWDPAVLASAAPRVEFENTNWLGNAKKYVTVVPPRGGYMFRSYELNHSYADCDVFVSLAKLKEHATTGITLSMKNCFGITPCTIYGSGAGKDEPSEFPQGGREPLHTGSRTIPGHPENDSKSPRQGGYRVPRVVADLVAARPLHLAVIDGIETMAGGEGPWIYRTRPCRPGVLIAGTNCVSTDAVAMAVMGFDPMADRGTPPFERCDSTLRLAEDLGAGTRDLRRIEVVGSPIAEVRFDFRKVPYRQHALFRHDGGPAEGSFLQATGATPYQRASTS